MAKLRVRPLHIGTITRQITTFCPILESEIVELPLISWLIEGSDKLILVDTGGGEPSEMPPQIHPYRREKEQTFEHVLQQAGFGCGDIDTVIVTHLHWDHCGGVQLFPEAEIIVQSEELRSASPFSPEITQPYRLLDGVDFTVVSGDVEISEGVKVILTPGHTHGLQGVLVDCDSGPVFIASDTFPLFKNIESDPPVMSNIYLDLEQYQKSAKMITELSSSVLPGHDFRVFEKEVYN